MMRIIWLNVLLGPIVFLIVIGIIFAKGGLQAGPADAHLIELLFYVSLGILGVLVPAGYCIRMTIYKMNWQGNAIKPVAYLNANTTLLSGVSK